MAEQLNQFLNKAFDFEEQGYVEKALKLCNECIHIFPDYKNEIAFEVAKMKYRNGQESAALVEFLSIYHETEDNEIHDLILEAYYGIKEQEYSKNYKENYKKLKEYPYFFGNINPPEICYYPIQMTENRILFYNSIEQVFQMIDRYRDIIEEPTDGVCITDNLLWMEDILLLEKMTRRKSPFMDQENALLLMYEREAWELLLQLFDLEKLIKFDRIIFYNDVNCLKASFIEEGVIFPRIFAKNISNRLMGVLSDINETCNEELRKCQSQILEYYNNNSEEVIKHIKEGKPKILFWTSHFTTILQYHVRDCQKAANRMGLETQLIKEKNRLSMGYNALFIFKKIAKFKPDIIFSIDHFRHEIEFFNNLKVVWICWIQDEIGDIMNKDTPSKLIKNDFIMNHFITWKKFKSIGYNEKYVIDAPIPADSFIYRPYLLNEDEKEKYSCDICFVCHASDVESHINEILKNLPEGLQEGIYDVYKEYKDYVYTGNNFYAEEDFEKYMKNILKNKYNISLSPKLLKYLSSDMSYFFSEKVFRQVLVDWILDAGFTNIKLWGNGWETEEKYKKYAMGPAQNGEMLSKVYQASKIVIGNNIHTTAAARAWETMLSGGFYISNYIPEKEDAVDIRKIIEEDKDVVMFYNREDLIEKLHYYLCHEEERQRMIKRGRKVALEKMTFDKLMEKVLKEVAERLC